MVEARRDFSFLLKFMQGKKKFSLPLFACMSNFVWSQVTHPSCFTGLLLRQRFYCTPCFNGTVPADEWKDCSNWIELRHSCSPRQDDAPWVSRCELELNLHRRVVKWSKEHRLHWPNFTFVTLINVNTWFAKGCQKIASGYWLNWLLYCFFFAAVFLSKVFPRPPGTDLSLRRPQRRRCWPQGGPPSCTAASIAARHWNLFLSRWCSW